jgi:hypothetical protein
MSTPSAKPPEILDKIVDVVLAHRTKLKLKAGKKKRASSTRLATKAKIRKSLKIHESRKEQ